MLILASCADVIGPTGGVIDVGFDPSPPSSLEVGSTAQLYPIPIGENGRVLEVACITEFESSDPSVATINAEGMITGISAGSTLITVRLNTVPRTFALTINEPDGPGNPDGPRDPDGPEDPDDPDGPDDPENPDDGPDDPDESDDSSLFLSAGSVSFSATRGAPNPAPQIVQVTSSDGPVSGLSVEVQQGISWLSASLGATATPADLSVVVDIAGLDVGSYLSTITVSGNDATPVTLQVTLSISDAGDPGDPEDPDDPEMPALLLSAGSASFSATQGGPNPAPQVVQVTSSGGPISGLSVEIPDSVVWLGAALDETTTPADLQLSADISGLETGTYVASVTISGTDATPVTLQVTLTISGSGDPEDPDDPGDPDDPEASDLLLSAGSVSFSATQGGPNPAPQEVQVTSSGGPVSGLTLEIPDSAAWLDGALSETATPADLQLSVDISGLDAGTHVASITISGNEATPATLEVTLTLEAAPAPVLIGLELEVEANVLGGGELLDLNLTELLSDPLLDATVWALYSDSSKVDVTETALLTTSDPLLVVDGPGVLNLAGVLVHSLLDPDHYLHAEYNGFVVEAGLRINVPGLGTLPILGLELQEILPGAELGAGTELPYVLALVDDGIGGSVDLLIPGSHPDIEWSLVPRLLDCGALPIVDQLLCGTVANPLLSTILNLTDEVLEITDGVVTGLDLGILSPILGILGGVLNADISAVVGGVVSDVVPIVIPLS